MRIAGGFVLEQGSRALGPKGAALAAFQNPAGQRYLAFRHRLEKERDAWYLYLLEQELLVG